MQHPPQPEDTSMFRWLDTPEPCNGPYPSVCNGQAVLRIQTAEQRYVVCKPCLKAMEDQINRIFEAKED